MMEPDAMRKYGYFYNGFGVNSSWWELLVKRMDVLYHNRTGDYFQEKTYGQYEDSVPFLPLECKRAAAWS